MTQRMGNSMRIGHKHFFLAGRTNVPEPAQWAMIVPREDMRRPTAEA